MLTRRILYFIPARGPCTLVHHIIDTPNIPDLPGVKVPYRGWRDLNRAVHELVAGLRFVAMEVFLGGAIPYLSRVDAGTVGWIREMGVRVVPSADLVQFFLCRFSPEQAEAHRAVVKELNEVKDEALAMVAQRLQARYPLVEYEVQQFIMERFARRNIITDHPPVASCGPHTANPHYVPSMDSSLELEEGQLLMVALWGRHEHADGAFADITWMAHLGQDPGRRVVEVFDLVLEARQRGVDLVQRRYDPGSKNGLAGWEVDRAVREVIEARGLGDCFTHRTGHNIGVMSGHGDGTHIDDLETHDTRPLIEGLCFSIEPGVYFEEEFGLRSGINLFLSPTGVEVSQPVQQELALVSTGRKPGARGVSSPA